MSKAPRKPTPSIIPDPGDLVWGTPPGGSSAGRPAGVSKWNPMAEALKTRPGEWAMISPDAASTAGYSITTAKLPCWEPKGSFEAVARSAEGLAPHRAQIWARYVGTPEHTE